MTDLGSCECCLVEPGVGVAAVPGAPMSIVWGSNCLRNHAVPFWIADFTVGECVPPTDLDWKHVADWFRDQSVYQDGSYVRLDALALREGECERCNGSGVVEGEPCAMCLSGRVATIRP